MSLTFNDIDPVAIAIGPLEIRWYALAYMAGFLLGWKYALWLVKSYKEKAKKDIRPSTDDIDNFIPFAVLGVILGGRLGYVLFYQSSLYLYDPLSVFKVWEGGMSFHGGALGVILALFLFSWRQKIPLLRLSDIVCATVPIGIFFGRIANFVNGELFGRPAGENVPWSFVFPWGGPEPRHPSQLYEAALEGALLFIILFILVRNERIRALPGIVTGAFLAGYGLFRLFVEQFREPDSHIGLLFDYISMGQLLSLPMVLLGSGVIVYALIKREKA